MTARDEAGAGGRARNAEGPAGQQERRLRPAVDSVALSPGGAVARRDVPQIAWGDCTETATGAPREALKRGRPEGKRGRGASRTQERRRPEPVQLPTAGPESRLRPVQAQMSTLRDSDTPRPMVQKPFHAGFVN